MKTIKIISITSSVLLVAVPLTALAQGGLPFQGALDKILAGLQLILYSAAAIMIVVAAFQFLNAGGDANKVSGAKMNLVYAIVAIIIAASAGAIKDWAMTLK
ncbi:hypothetical protein KKG36_00615 [Patescibacteria group bacterium]|nr:hypothetical protein [Patescibacteria group bacterium]